MLRLTSLDTQDKSSSFSSPECGAKQLSYRFTTELYKCLLLQIRGEHIECWFYCLFLCSVHEELRRTGQCRALAGQRRG